MSRKPIAENSRIPDFGLQPGSSSEGYLQSHLRPVSREFFKSHFESAMVQPNEKLRKLIEECDRLKSSLTKLKNFYDAHQEPNSTSAFQQ